MKKTVMKIIGVAGLVAITCGFSWMMGHQAGVAEADGCTTVNGKVIVAKCAGDYWIKPGDGRKVSSVSKIPSRDDESGNMYYSARVKVK